MNIVFHDPKCFMSIGIGHDAGLADVPDDRFMRNMPAGFMLDIFMPGMLPAMWSSCLCSSCAQTGRTIKAQASQCGNVFLLIFPPLKPCSADPRSARAHKQRLRFGGRMKKPASSRVEKALVPH